MVVTCVSGAVSARRWGDQSHHTRRWLKVGTVRTPEACLAPSWWLRHGGPGLRSHVSHTTTLPCVIRPPTSCGATSPVPFQQRQSQSHPPSPRDGGGGALAFTSPWGTDKVPEARVGREVAFSLLLATSGFPDAGEREPRSERAKTVPDPGSGASVPLSGNGASPGEARGSRGGQVGGADTPVN